MPFSKGHIPWNKNKQGLQIGYWNEKHRDGETKEKIRRGMRGKKNALGYVPTEEHRTKISNTKKGKKLSGETKRRMSKARKGRIGDKSSNWKGGITSENERIRHGIEIRLWRESVFARDNWTCQKCGKRGVKLCAHHIKGFAKCKELRTSVENGITLCKECHILEHKELAEKKVGNKLKKKKKK